MESPASAYAGEQSRKLKRLEIRWHCGLSDAILLSPLFRVFLKKHRPDQVVVPVVDYGKSTVWHLYSQIAESFGAQLFVRAVPSGRLNEIYRTPFWPGDVLRVTIGSGAPGFVYLWWDRSFYEQAGVDPDIRFSEFSLPSDVYGERNPVLARFRRSKPYVVVHESVAYGKRVPPALVAELASSRRVDVVRVTDAGSLLWWAPIFEGADELFMVDSGPANLANSLRLRGCLNIFAGDTPPPTMLNPGNRTLVHYRNKRTN